MVYGLPQVLYAGVWKQNSAIDNLYAMPFGFGAVPRYLGGIISFRYAASQINYIATRDPDTKILKEEYQTEDKRTHWAALVRL